MTPKDEMRVLAGLVVQPVVAGFAAYFLFPFLDDRIEGALPVAMAAGLSAVFVTLLGALPAIAWFSRAPVTLSKTLTAGAVLGNSPVAVLMLLIALHPNSSSTDSGAADSMFAAFPVIAFGTAIGLICAAAFWWIAGRHLSITPTAL